MPDIWSTVHAERQALATDLADLTTEQWATRSLCGEWDVHDVLAHIVATAKLTPLKFVALFTRAGFDFDRFVANQVAIERASDPQKTLAEFRSAASLTASPPARRITRIIEAYVHGEDIRRPLGIAHVYPVEHIEAALRYVAGDRLTGGKARLDGITLSPTDAEFTVGSGPVVEGSAISLLVAASGRKVAVAELAGAGLATLAGRF